MDPSGLVAGEVDHPGQLLGATRSRVAMVPDVLVEPQGPDPGEPGLIACPPFEDGLDRTPRPRASATTPHTGQPISCGGVETVTVTRVGPHSTLLT